ncbi:hypothetical protein C8R44DRAFT_786241 [Mycena epipterygia]|nr:hypothetical protein C8R44DRAFT_786241 [Mycena epipterygia]
MSKYIHSLKVGDSFYIKSPIHKFPYKENEFKEVALVGGGSGMQPDHTTAYLLTGYNNTPPYQIISRALTNPFNTTKFKLLFSNVVYLLDKPSPDWKGPTGFINADVIKKYVAPPTTERTLVMVCGPPGQVAALAGKKAGMKQGELSGVLKELGYTEDQVFKF